MRISDWSSDVCSSDLDKAFAAGADIKEMADQPAADFYLQDFFSKWTSDFVKKIRKPWIAAVNGFSLGGGCALAMVADFTIARSEESRVGQERASTGRSRGSPRL